MYTSFALRKTFAQFALAVTVISAAVCVLAEDAEARPRLRYSGGSNGNTTIDSLLIDSSVSGTPESNNSFRFKNAISSLVLTRGVGISPIPPNQKIDLGSADLVSSLLAPGDFFDVFGTSGVKYTATFSNVNLINATSDEVLTFYVRTSNPENALSSLKLFEELSISGPDGGRGDIAIELQGAATGVFFGRDGFEKVDIPDPEPPNPEPVPEPITGTILGAGALGGALILKRRKAKQAAETASESETVEVS